jgi:hypothetical protein
MNPVSTDSADRFQVIEDKSQACDYVAPAIYVIGRSHDLLQGSGRHKNDDTGSRGFEVDQR